MTQYKGNDEPTLPSTKKKSYKIVLESVTQEKKKLESVISYNDEAPRGYTFVPVGVPELTDYCKEISREQGLDVYIVSTAPQNAMQTNPNSISHHIHRIGHHFRNQVVEQACDMQGYRHRGHGYVRDATEGFVYPTALTKKLDTHGQTPGSNGRQQVRATIKELFPKIPEEDVEAIVTRAFKVGTDRVGNANLPLPRRVQLAVVAHIRHKYTDYDVLLHAFTWIQAREMVEQPCLDQIVKWRGEDQEEAVELEDIFREVIIIDDEEEEGEGEKEGGEAEEAQIDKTIEPSKKHQNNVGNDGKSNCEQSVQIISTRVQPDETPLIKGSKRGPEEPEHIHSQARTTAPMPKQDATGIVHVQPQRDMRKVPVLTWQEHMQNRYNAARARHGWDGVLNQRAPAAQDVRKSAPGITSSKSLHSMPPDQKNRARPNAPNIGLKSFSQRVDDMNGQSNQLPVHLRPMYVPLTHQTITHSQQQDHAQEAHRPIYVPPTQGAYRTRPEHPIAESHSTDTLRSGIEDRSLYGSSEYKAPISFDTHHATSRYVGKRKSELELDDRQDVTIDYEAYHKRPRINHSANALAEGKSKSPFKQSPQRQRWGSKEFEVIDLTNSPDGSKLPGIRSSLSTGSSPKYPLQPPPPLQYHGEMSVNGRPPTMIDSAGTRFYVKPETDEFMSRKRVYHQMDGAVDHGNRYHTLPSHRNATVDRVVDLGHHSSWRNEWRDDPRFDRRVAALDPAYDARGAVMPVLDRRIDVHMPDYDHEHEYDYEYDHMEPHFRAMRINNNGGTSTGANGYGYGRGGSSMQHSGSRAYRPNVHPHQ